MLQLVVRPLGSGPTLPDYLEGRRLQPPKCVAAPNIDPFRPPTLIPARCSNSKWTLALAAYQPGQRWAPVRDQKPRRSTRTEASQPRSPSREAGEGCPAL